MATSNPNFPRSPSAEILKAQARKIPPHKRRRGIGKILYPHAFQIEYQTKVRRITTSCHEQVEKLILPILPTLIPGGIGKATTDSKSSTIAKIKALASRNVLEIWDDKRIRQMTNAQGIAIGRANKRQLEQKLTQAIGVGFTFADAFDNAMAEDLLQDFAAEGIILIKSIPEEFFEDLQKRIVKAVRTGVRVEELSKELQSRYDVSKSRANLIARDQTTKLYGKFNRRRQQSLGLSKYEWDTVGDNKVRETHEDLQGETYEWDNPPVTNDEGETNNPGEDYQCRCTGSPILSFDF